MSSIVYSHTTTPLLTPSTLLSTVQTLIIRYIGVKIIILCVFSKFYTNRNPSFVMKWCFEELAAHL